MKAIDWNRCIDVRFPDWAVKLHFNGGVEEYYAEDIELGDNEDADNEDADNEDGLAYLYEDENEDELSAEDIADYLAFIESAEKAGWSTASIREVDEEPAYGLPPAFGIAGKTVKIRMYHYAE